MKILRIVLGLLFITIIATTIIFTIKSEKQISIPPVQVKNDRVWSLTAVGDIMLSRQVAAQIDEFGSTYPFENIAKSTESTNLTVGNLESPFTTNEVNTKSGSMVFGAGIKSVEGLKMAGFDLVNLANNHFSNQGQEGMNLTFDTLNQNNIDYFGAGTNFQAAHTPLIKDVNRVKIAFLGYSDSDVLPGNSIAKETLSGLAVMDINQAKIDIEKAKTMADMVIVSMHSGTEYTPNPNSRQIEFAHAAIDSGADLVLGHHPHVVQAIEDYKGKKIFYSLGNFVFDQAWSNETMQGLMVKLTFNNTKLTNTELIPIKIENWCQPRVLLPTEPEYDSILNRINTASENLL